MSQEAGYSSNGINERGIADGWRPLPFNEAVLLNPTVRFERGEVYSFVRMTDISADARSAYPSEQRPYRGGGSRFRNGDTLMARITPCLENGKMARALFKAWFVDFEPVRAKIEGRWHRGKSLPGMPAELYDLFPDRFVDSELGAVPEGWEVGTVGGCFNLTMGQSPPDSTYNDDGEGMPFFQGSADFGFRYPDNRRYCTAPNRIAEPDDTLVSVRAPVGTINRAWEKCCIGRGLATLRHKSGCRSFTYYAVNELQREIAQYEHTGTVFGAINKQQFETLLTLEPPAKVIDAFHAFVQNWDERIRLNTAENHNLADLRDTLLPKLISGEVRT